MSIFLPLTNSSYMRKLYPKILLLAFASIFSFSCEENTDPDPIPSTYPDLAIFMERFVTEAKARGLNLNTSAVDLAYLDEIKFPDGTPCGYGWTSHPDTGKRTVFISKSASCNWATLSDLKRE